MEFLGDTVLQLITSEYLYKHFPEHHEGHLSLLRSSIVNNRTQAVVCDDVGIPEFAAVANPNRKTVDLKVMPKKYFLLFLFSYHMYVCIFRFGIVIFNWCQLL